jgi:hypothetical protein
MKLLKAKLQNQKKKIFQISDLNYVKNGLTLQAILDGEDMINPIEIIRKKISETPRMGAANQPYNEHKYAVHKGSSRIQAAVKLGYTHIEGIIINE